MIGQLLNERYRIEAELGRGGMGVVYRAHDILLDRDVAVKVLSATALSDEGRVRLLREAQAAAKLNHPNIVSVYDVSEANHQSFIVMEYVPGRPLLDCRSDSFEEMLAVVRQVCAALAHAHAHGIIHRDLKPENIVIAADGSAKLMDFGLARTGDAPHITAEGTLVGTFAYLAPELVQGQPASPQSDLYALGVILYECVTGQLPFTGENMMEVLSQHLYATVIPPSTHNPGIPPVFESLIMRLLSKRADERPTSASEVLREIEKIAAHPAAALTRDASGELSALDRLVRGRLVGRDHELEEARALWQGAISGGQDSRVLLISGEPGIGKTRLVRELLTLAQLSRAAALSGECYAEGSAPYAPVAQVIQSAFAPIPLLSSPLASGVMADLITLAPSLRVRYPDIGPNPPLEAQAEQQRLYESVAEFCMALSPLLLVVEDVHWADGGTLALLRHLARRARAARARVLIVLTYREVELDDARALNDMLHDLNRERLATRIKLTRLSREQTGELLAAILAEESTREFLDGIYRETEGNPFFVEEVCKALIEDGKLTRENGRWQRSSMEEIEIPQSIRMAVQARVNRLPAPAQEVLRLASILGREFDFEALAAMSDLDEEALIEALETAERAQLITEIRVSPPLVGHARLSFAFAHALIPSALHEGMSGLRRQRLHRRAAEALERLHPDRLTSRELAPQLGRHYSEAGQWERAADYLLVAGERAREVYAYQEAIGYLQQALALLKEQASGELDRAARTAMKLGMLYHTTFDYQRSRQAFQDAFALWQRAGETQPTVSLPPAPHALRQYWHADIETLDPALANDATSIPLIEQLFCGLVELTPEMDIAPSLARTWEISSDGREYVFRLRGDARWSDGAPVTASDFEYAWKRVLSPATNSLFVEMLLDLKGARAFHSGQAPDPSTVGVRALDELTLLVELEEPVGHFLYLLAMAVACPIPRHVVEAHGEDWTAAEHLVTNGPFRLETWVRKERVVLVRNPDYRGRFSGNLSRVELDLIGSHTPEILLARYEADLHDIGQPEGPEMIEQARLKRTGEYTIAPAAHTSYVGLDTTRPPFDDVRVRRALVHAVDRQAIADVVWGGIVSPATGGFVPPGMPGHSPGIGLGYDPPKARRLLAEAGYPNGRGFPAIDAVSPSQGLVRRSEQYVQAQWRDNLGIHVTWEWLDWLAYKERLRTSAPHLHVMGWIADYPDPDTALRVAMHQPYCRWHNEQYERTLEAARRITDEAERTKFYRAADRLLIEEAAILPLFHGRYHQLVKPWVKRFPISPIGASYWEEVIIERH